MGMYDTFVGKTKCPKCNEDVYISEQTKQYDCTLADIKVGDYIDKGNANYFYPCECICKHCGTRFGVYAGIRRGQLIGYYTNISGLNINEMDNIEDGYTRKREYEEMCKNGYGPEPGKVIYTKEPYKIGDIIHILNRDWTIKKIYKQELDKEDKSYQVNSLFFYNNWCYSVVDKDGNERFIVANELSTVVCHLPNEQCSKFRFRESIGTKLIEYK